MSTATLSPHSPHHASHATPHESTSATSPTEQMTQIVGGFWASRAVYAAAKLGLADLLAEEPKTLDQLAQATHCNPASLYRLLRALTSIGCFREDSPGMFITTPLGETLRTNAPGSLRHVIMACIGQEHYVAWDDILHAVKTGETAFDHRFGEPIWAYYDKHRQEAKTFDQAMTDFTQSIDPALLKAYPFGKFAHIVDVGGGHGALLAAILNKNPGVRGTVFDQPRVAGGASKALCEAGLAKRTTVVGGNFFESVPEGGDAYLMKFIIHDWDDAKSLQILRNIRKAIAPDGKLLLVETVIPRGNGAHLGKFMDLNMLVMTGGRERTEREFANLLAAAGFRPTRVVPTESFVSIIESVPA